MLVVLPTPFTPMTRMTAGLPEDVYKRQPVDWYNGGMEHTTLHLLYSRFWHKFLYDIGAVPSPEPYQKRTAHGMILGLNPVSYTHLREGPEDRRRSGRCPAGHHCRGDDAGG